MSYIDETEQLDACPEAVEWLRTEQHPTLAAAWNACHRGDWMLWLAGLCAGNAGDPQRILLAAACTECAELALPYAHNGGHPRRIIDTIRAWARGEVTLEDVRDVAQAEVDADWPTWAAADAAWATAAVKIDAAASAAANVAANAAKAMATAAWTINDAKAAEATEAVGLAKCAGIVRRHYPAPPTLTT